MDADDRLRGVCVADGELVTVMRTFVLATVAVPIAQLHKPGGPAPGP